MARASASGRDALWWDAGSHSKGELLRPSGVSTSVSPRQAFYRQWHSSGLVTRACVWLAVTLQQVWSYYQFNLRGYSPPHTVALFCASYVALVLLCIAELCLLVVTRTHRARAGGTGPPRGRERLHWLSDSPFLDIAWLVTLCVSITASQVTFITWCGDPVRGPLSVSCRAYATGPASVPLLFVFMFVAIVPLVSSIWWANGIVVLFCYGLVWAQWAAYFGPPARAPNPVAAVAIPQATAVLATLATAIILVRADRDRFFKQVQSEEQFLRYLSDVRALQEANAETAAAVSDAVLSYTFHTLRNPLHTISAIVDEWCELADERSSTRQRQGLAQGIEGGDLGSGLPATATATAATTVSATTRDVAGSGSRARGPPRSVFFRPGLSSVRRAVAQLVHRLQHSGRLSLLLSRRVVPQPEPVTFCTWLESVIGQACTKHSVVLPIAWRVSPDVPTTIQLDPLLLGEVVGHSLDNAVLAAGALLAEEPGGALPVLVQDALKLRGLPHSPVFVLVSLVRQPAVVGDAASLLPLPYSGEQGDTARSVAQSPVSPAPLREGQTDPAPSDVYLRLEVCNVGHGLPEGIRAEDLTDPFQPFLQRAQMRTMLGTASRSAGLSQDKDDVMHVGVQPAGGGAGLRSRTRTMGTGLSIVRLTVQLLQGHVRIQDDPEPLAHSLRAQSRADTGMSGGSMPSSDEVPSPWATYRYTAPRASAASEAPPRAWTQSTSSHHRQSASVYPSPVVTTSDTTRSGGPSLGSLRGGPQGRGGRPPLPVRVTRLVIEVPLVAGPHSLSRPLGQPSNEYDTTQGPAPTVPLRPSRPSEHPGSDTLLLPREGVLRASSGEEATRHRGVVEAQDHGEQEEGEGSEESEGSAFPAAVAEAREEPSLSALAGVVATPANRRQGQAQGTEGEPGGRATDLAGLRILAVDDEGSVRRATERMLTRAGALVTTCDDGDQVLPALQAAQEAGQPFDVVLMDVIMQRMNGDEACMQVRAAEFPSLPIIAATGNTGPADVREYRAAGMSSVLAKPFRAADVAQALHQANQAHGSDHGISGGAGSPA